MSHDIWDFAWWSGGLWPYLALVFFAFLPSEFWRVLSIYVVRGIDPHSEVAGMGAGCFYSIARGSCCQHHCRTIGRFGSRAARRANGRHGTCAGGLHIVSPLGFWRCSHGHRLNDSRGILFRRIIPLTVTHGCARHWRPEHPVFPSGRNDGAGEHLPSAAGRGSEGEKQSAPPLGH